MRLSLKGLLASVAEKSGGFEVIEFEKCQSHGNRVRLLIYFDEAHCLFEGGQAEISHHVPDNDSEKTASVDRVQGPAPVDDIKLHTAKADDGILQANAVTDDRGRQPTEAVGGTVQSAVANVMKQQAAGTDTMPDHQLAGTETMPDQQPAGIDTMLDQQTKASSHSPTTGTLKPSMFESKRSLLDALRSALNHFRAFDLFALLLSTNSSLSALAPSRGEMRSARFYEDPPLLVEPRQE